MSPYEHIKPRYVREWYLKLKARMKVNRAKREAEEKRAIEDDEPSSPAKFKNASPGFEMEDDEYEDKDGHE